MKKQAEDWLFHAKMDLAAVEQLIYNPELTAIAAFHAQQAIEKILKAVIADHAAPVPRIHNLLTLYDQAHKKGSPTIDIEKLARINLVY